MDRLTKICGCAARDDTLEYLKVTFTAEVIGKVVLQSSDAENYFASKFFKKAYYWHREVDYQT